MDETRASQSHSPVHRILLGGVVAGAGFGASALFQPLGAASTFAEGFTFEAVLRAVVLIAFVVVTGMWGSLFAARAGLRRVPFSLTLFLFFVAAAATAALLVASPRLVEVVVAFVSSAG